MYEINANANANHTETDGGVNPTSILSTRINMVMNDVSDLRSIVSQTQDIVEDQLAHCEESMQEKIQSCDVMFAEAQQREEENKNTQKKQAELMNQFER